MKVIIRERLGEDYYEGNIRIVQVEEGVSVAWVGEDDDGTVIITTRERCQAKLERGNTVWLREIP